MIASYDCEASCFESSLALKMVLYEFAARVSDSVWGSLASQAWISLQSTYITVLLNQCQREAAALSHGCPSKSRYGGWSLALLHCSKDEVGDSMGMRDSLEWVGHLLYCILYGKWGRTAAAYSIWWYMLLYMFLISRTNFPIQCVQSIIFISSSVVVHSQHTKG